MKKDEKIQKLLNRISKKGDIYDAISKKKNVNREATITKIIKTHICLFSRILYLAITFSSKIKNKFTSVKKVKEEQDEIREYLGVPIDICRTKDRKKELVVSYLNYRHENNYLNRDYLIDSLKKIDEFCKIYNINRVYLEKHFLSNHLSSEYFDDIPYKWQSDIVKIEDYNHFSVPLLDLDIKKLEEIIDELEKCEYNQQFISSIRNKITDDIIKRAIDDFMKNNDARKLLNTVINRLLFHLNSDTMSKDRTYGKIYEQIDLGGTFIRVSKYDKNGSPISKDVMTLYNYLDVNDYKDLMSCLNVFTDDQEMKLIALLYLHILGENKIEEIGAKEIVSFYDFIYDSYRKKPILKKVPWVKNKFQKIRSEVRQYLISISSLILTYILIALSIIIPRSLNASEEYLKTYKDILYGIADLYEQSAQLEDRLVYKLKQAIKKLLPEKEEVYKSYNNQSFVEKRVAEIEWFSEEKMPIYFMDKYASYGNYRDNEISYWYDHEDVNLDKIEDVRPMFQVKTPISNSSLEIIADRDFLRLPLELYPIGDDYVINQVYIVDNTDPTKLFYVDTKWYEKSYGCLTDEEKELLKSMDTPMICYIYGLSNNDNTMIDFTSPQYTQSDPDEVKSAILRGLELTDEATEDDINAAIKSKKYTSSPDIESYKTLDEVEYYEQIAALNKINPDIAIALTVNTNSDLIYTVGYKNLNNDDEITTSETYVWVMNENGDIIDILSNFSKNEETGLGEFTNNDDTLLSYQEDGSASTYISYDERKEQQENLKWTYEQDEKKSEKEEKDTLQSILTWAKDNHVPYYLAAILACLIIYKIFGKKIRIKMQFKHAHNILNDEDIGKTYAKLLYLIYGEESDAINRSEEEMIDLITKELAILKEEDIKSLLKKIKVVMSNNNDKEAMQKVKELLKHVSFIIKENETLKQTAGKKLVLGGKNEN